MGLSVNKEDFLIGQDNFDDLEIRQSENNDQFYYFYHTREKRLITQFVLDRRPQVDYLCRISLIKKGEKFSPRLALSVRDKSKKIVEHQPVELTKIKANVDLTECHESFWKLIEFLQSLKEIEIPRGRFSLVSQNESEIVAALRGRGAQSVVNIIKHLLAAKDVALTQNDINSVLKRRERLAEFQGALNGQGHEEWWQDFFETNKWIFGYGLNYEILRQQQGQPHYGGTRVDRTGGQRGDHLMSTMGDLNFTVLVEIKTPATPLLQGKNEIRTGAWSLSKELSDALVQIQANIQTWELEGSKQAGNKDELEAQRVYTVKPKGIIVIGALSEVKNQRHRWETFQRFRKSVHGIDIITFDELLHRARFIVEGD